MNADEFKVEVEDLARYFADPLSEVAVRITSKLEQLSRPQLRIVRDAVDGLLEGRPIDQVLAQAYAKIDVGRYDETP